MYSGTHHGGNSGRLYLQRLLCSYRSFVVIFVCVLFTIFLYYYNQSLAILKSREIEVNRCQQKLDSISAQLQVVYEHKSRLEKALTGDKEACTTRIAEVQKSLDTAKKDLEKTQTELKNLQSKQTVLQKEVTDLKAAKEASEKAVSKAGIDAAQVKDQYAKEAEAYKGENTKLNALVLQLQTALNKSLEQLVLLQQQNEQYQRMGILQQQQRNVQPSYNTVLKDAMQLLPNQMQQVVGQQQKVAFATQSILAAPNANISAAGQQVNQVYPPQPQAKPVHPQPEQVAVPIAERQQQLLAQQQVPLQQQQVNAPAPVLQHPLGEDQQKLLMPKPNNSVLAPGAPAAAQAPLIPPPNGGQQPLQQQAPPPAGIPAVISANNSNPVAPRAAPPEAQRTG